MGASWNRARTTSCCAWGDAITPCIAANCWARNWCWTATTPPRRHSRASRFVRGKGRDAKSAKGKKKREGLGKRGAEVATLSRPDQGNHKGSPLHTGFALGPGKVGGRDRAVLSHRDAIR